MKKSATQIRATFTKSNSEVLVRKVKSGNLKAVELKIAQEILTRRGVSLTSRRKATATR